MSLNLIPNDKSLVCQGGLQYLHHGNRAMIRGRYQQPALNGGIPDRLGAEAIVYDRDRDCRTFRSQFDRLNFTFSTVGDPELSVISAGS